jgi:hypothetical protein
LQRKLFEVRREKALLEQKIERESLNNNIKTYSNSDDDDDENRYRHQHNDFPHRPVSALDSPSHVPDDDTNYGVRSGEGVLQTDFTKTTTTISPKRMKTTVEASETVQVPVPSLLLEDTQKTHNNNDIMDGDGNNKIGGD